MPQKPSRIADIYAAIPAPIPAPVECGGLMCLNLECRQCWGVVDELNAIFESAPGVAVDLDEATYAALSDVARRQGTTVPAVVQVILQKWAKGSKAPRRVASSR